MKSIRGSEDVERKEGRLRAGKVEQKEKREERGGTKAREKEGGGKGEREESV